MNSDEIFKDVYFILKKYGFEEKSRFKPRLMNGNSNLNERIMFVRDEIDGDPALIMNLWFLNEDLFNFNISSTKDNHEKFDMVANDISRITLFTLINNYCESRF